MSLECRLSRPEDLPRIAACHMRAFPNALATRHGRRFVQKMLEWYLIADTGILFHIEDKGRVVGYVGGIRNEPGQLGAFTSISQYAFWTFATSFLMRPWLLFHPEMLDKRATIKENVLLRFGLRRKPKNLTQVTDTRRNWGLVVIGVDPDYHGRGYGATLLQEFERRARADGAKFMRLSVKSANRQAIKSYERNGWAVASVARDSQSMQKSLE